MNPNKLTFVARKLRYFKLWPKIYLNQRRFICCEDEDEENRKRSACKKEECDDATEKYKRSLAKKRKHRKIMQDACNEVVEQRGGSSSADGDKGGGGGGFGIGKFIGFLLKLIVAGGFVYATILLNVWGTPKQTNRLCDKVIQAAMGHSSDPKDPD